MSYQDEEDLFGTVSDLVLSLFCPKRRDHSHKHSNAEEPQNEEAKQSTSTKEDPYEVLGLEPNASLADIRRAYRRLALLHHPDKNNGNPESERRFLQIRLAYDQLLAERSSKQDAKDDGAAGEEQDEDDWEECARQAQKDANEQYKRFEKECKRFRQSKAVRRKAKRGKEMLDEVYAEFAFSRNEVALAIRCDCIMVLRDLLQQSPSLEEDLGRGSTPLHFAAYAGNEKAAMIIMSLAGREWFHLVGAVNDDGLTPASIGIRFQPDSRLTEMLLTWEEQANGAKDNYAKEESRVPHCSNIVCGVGFLLCFWYFGSVIVWASFFTGALLFQDQRISGLTHSIVTVVTCFSCALVLGCCQRELRSVVVDVSGDDIFWDALWSTSVQIFASYRRRLSGSDEIIDTCAGLCICWDILRVWDWVFASNASFWKWCVVLGLAGFRYYEIACGLALFSLLLGSWMTYLCVEHAAIGICIGTLMGSKLCHLRRHVLSFKNRISDTIRVFRPRSSCEQLALRSQMPRKTPSPSYLAGDFTEKPTSCDEEDQAMEAKRRQERLRDHQLLIVAAEARQTSVGRSRVMEQLHKNSTQAQQEDQRLRQREEKAQEARRQKEEQRRQEEVALQEQRAKAISELSEAMLKGSLQDLKKAVALGSKLKLNEFGQRQLLKEAQEKLSNLAIAEQEAARKAAAEQAALRRAEALERERVEAEEKRKKNEEERRKRIEEKQRKDEAERLRKEAAQKMKDAEKQRKAEEQAVKKQQEQVRREEERQRKEEERRKRLLEKEARVAEEAKRKEAMKKIEQEAQERELAAQREEAQRHAEMARRRRVEKKLEAREKMPASFENGCEPAATAQVNPAQRKLNTGYVQEPACPSGVPLKSREMIVKTPSHPPPPPPPPLKKRSVVRTSGLCAEPEPMQVFMEYQCPTNGYLTASAGVWIMVHFWQGPDEYEENGWAFGRLLGDDSQQGWIPQRVLSAPEELT